MLKLPATYVVILLGAISYGVLGLQLKRFVLERPLRPSLKAVSLWDDLFRKYFNAYRPLNNRTFDEVKQRALERLSPEQFKTLRSDGIRKIRRWLQGVYGLLLLFLVAVILIGISLHSIFLSIRIDWRSSVSIIASVLLAVSLIGDFILSSKEESALARWKGIYGGTFAPKIEEGMTKPYFMVKHQIMAGLYGGSGFIGLLLLLTSLFLHLPDPL